MKKVTSKILIMAGLVILLAGFLIYYVTSFNLLNSEVQSLQANLSYANLSLNQTQYELTQVSLDLAKEKAKAVSTNVSKLRNFSSVEELESFLAEDTTNEHQYIENEFDCDDFARTLQKNALEKGYLMNCQFMFQHMFNMVIIDNEIYYIEPITDEITFMNYMDDKSINLVARINHL